MPANARQRSGDTTLDSLSFPLFFLNQHRAFHLHGMYALRAFRCSLCLRKNGTNTALPPPLPQKERCSSALQTPKIEPSHNHRSVYGAATVHLPVTDQKTSPAGPPSRSTSTPRSIWGKIAVATYSTRSVHRRAKNYARPQSTKRA